MGLVAMLHAGPVEKVKPFLVVMDLVATLHAGSVEKVKRWASVKVQKGSVEKMKWHRRY